MLERIVIGVVLGAWLAWAVGKDINSDSTTGIPAMACLIFVMYSASYGVGYFFISLIEIVVGFGVAVSILGNKKL